MLSIKNFSKCEHLFRKVELFFNTGISFSQGKFLLAGCEMLAFPRVLGTVPLDEFSLSGILQLWNRRFQVSGMQSRGNSCWHLVIARRDNAVAILSAKKRIASPLRGSQ